MKKAWKLLCHEEGWMLALFQFFMFAVMGTFIGVVLCGNIIGCAVCGLYGGILGIYLSLKFLEIV